MSQPFPKGQAKIKAEVTYTPDGGDACTHSKKVKLISGNPQRAA